MSISKPSFIYVRNALLLPFDFLFREWDVQPILTSQVFMWTLVLPPSTIPAREQVQDNEEVGCHHLIWKKQWLRMNSSSGYRTLCKPDCLTISVAAPPLTAQLPKLEAAQKAVAQLLMAAAATTRERKRGRSNGDSSHLLWSSC